MLKVRSNSGSFSQNFFRVAAASVIALFILMGAVSASAYAAGTNADRDATLIRAYALPSTSIFLTPRSSASLSTATYFDCLPAVTVTSLLDSGPGSLRQAVIDVCAGGTITFALTGTIGITSGTINLTKDVNIVGPGADMLTINHTTAALSFRMFTTGSAKNVSFSGVTISNPYAGTEFTGGILSNGNLSLDRVVLTGIKAGNSVAVANVSGILSIANSTISNNTSLNQGSAVYAFNSQVSIVNTTISGNTCRTQGGGIFISSHGGGPYALNITNSTITDNHAGPEGNSTGGGGISIYSDLPSGAAAINATLRNTIVAGNSPNNFKVDLDGGSTNAHYISGGHNIDGDGISGFTNGVNGDKVGTANTPLNALLAPLGANGGPTPTHALLKGSPAIDGGLNLSGLTTDQRGVGFPRTVDLAAANAGDGTDIGAFETQVDFDYTAPVITPNVSGALGNNNWYTSNVGVSWSVTDDGSVVSSQTGCDLQTVDADTSGVTFTCSATSAGGSESKSVTIKRDATAPTLAPTVTPNPVAWKGLATATANATDALSGIASQSCQAVDTSTVGTKTLSCTATDLAGNTNTANVSYVVNNGYNFRGFFQPVDNLPTLNIVTGGQAIPVKFSLGGNQALNIFAPGYPTSAPVACDSNEPGSTIDQTVTAGGSSLSYDAATDQYGYVWKSDRAWKGTCRMFVLRLADGTEHYAKFRFR